MLPLLQAPPQLLTSSSRSPSNRDTTLRSTASPRAAMTSVRQAAATRDHSAAMPHKLFANDS